MTGADRRLLAVIAVALVSLLLYTVSGLVVLLFLAFLLIVALLPVVRFLKAKKIPKTVTMLGMVVVLFGALGFLLFITAPAIAEQSNAFFASIPGAAREIAIQLGVPKDLSFIDALSQHIGQIGQSVFSFSMTAVAVLASGLIVVTLVVYGLIYYDQTSRSIIGLAKSEQKRRRHQELLKKIEGRLGTWVKGQLLLSVIIGGLAWLAYTIVGLPFAGVLALIAGLFEVVPNLGPVLAAIPALLIALSVSPETFFYTLGAYLFIQAAESYLIAPKVMSSAVKLNPFLIIVVLTAGVHILGPVGALIAIPFTLAVIEISAFWRKRNQRMSA